MILPLRTKVARKRAQIACWLLDRMLRGQRALWECGVYGVAIPQMHGKILSVNVSYDVSGWPEGLEFRWLAEGHSIRDIRTVNVKALRYDGRIKGWTFYDC